MVLWWLVVGCGGPADPGDGDPQDTDVAPGDTDTDTDSDADSDTDSDADSDTDVVSTAETGTVVDCTALPAPPIPTVRLTGPPADEDFAFDDTGLLISFANPFMVKSEYPPGAVDPWVSTPGSSGAVASIRMLSTGDLVYHNVDTSALYKIDPGGGETVLFSGFGYAGGIEIGPGDLIYIVDLTGIHLVDPVSLSHQITLQNASWSSPNGISLSEDYSTLYVSARTGIYAVPLDAAGQVAGAETLWADAPAGASELLGMGVDECGNVYVTGSLGGISKVWRYAAGGGAPPEVLLERPGGWLSNLQWGSGLGGWDDQRLYVVDRSGNPGYDELEVGVGEKPR